MLPKQGQVEKWDLTNPVPSTREDPRVIRTRQLLVQAFMDLLKEKSFQSITIQDIASRATVNRVTFYAHFADKYALLERTIREMICQRLRSQAPEGSPYSPEELARLILTVCEFLRDIEQVCPPPHGHLEPLMEKQIKAELYVILQAWLPERRAAKTKPQPKPEQAAMVASWAIYGAAIQWMQQEQQEPVDEYVRQVLPLILGILQQAVD